MSPATPAVAAAPDVKAPATPDPKAAAAPSDKPAAAEPPKVGTTDRLFSDMAGTSVRGAPPAPAAGAPQDKGGSPAPAPAPEVIDLSALAGKMVKIKVDGKDEVVTAEEAFRRVQLDAHLTQKAQELAAKEKSIAEREIALKTPTPAAPPAAPSVLDKSILMDDPAVQKLFKDSADMAAEIARLNAAAAPMKHAQNMGVIDADLKSKGFDDFEKFRPQLEQKFNSATPEQRAGMDNANWWEGEYQTLKLRELMGKGPAPAAPVVPPVTRPAGGAMPDIAGGGGSTRSAIPADEALAAVRAAFQRAQASGGDIEAWALYEKLNREYSAMQQRT